MVELAARSLSQICEFAADDSLSLNFYLVIFAATSAVIVPRLL